MFACISLRLHSIERMFGYRTVFYLIDKTSGEFYGVQLSNAVNVTSRAIQVRLGSINASSIYSTKAGGVKLTI